MKKLQDLIRGRIVAYTVRLLSPDNLTANCSLCCDCQHTPALAVFFSTPTQLQGTLIWKINLEHSYTAKEVCTLHGKV